MRINVLAFARVREILGSGETSMEMPVACTVRDLWNVLAGRHGDLNPLQSSIRFARNGTIVQPQTQLHDGDEVALLPPVSGG